MIEFIDLFNNREKAIFIWLIIFFVWFFSSRNRRTGMKQPIVSLLKILFWGKIGIALLTMTIYVALIILFLWKINLWDISLLKDTLFWFVGSAFVMFINMNKVSTEKHYFQKLVLDNIKFVAILQFIINFFVFNIVIELVIVPILFVVTAMLAISKTKPEFSPVKKLLNIVLSIIGIVFILYAISQLVINFKDFATTENLKDFLLTPLLTMAYIPFIYILAVYSAYDSLFTRIGIFVKNNNEFVHYIKWQAFRNCFLNLNKINTFGQQIMTIKDKSDVKRVVSTL